MALPEGLTDRLEREHEWVSGDGRRLALGKLRGPNTYPCIVTVRADGYVVALKGDVANNSTDAVRELWHYQIPVSPVHRYYRGFVAAPLIADVNNDTYQDVIVGTTHGEVYILSGVTGQPILGTPYHTFLGPDSVWQDRYVNPNTFTSEPQFEEVRGLALGPLKGNSPSHAILVVTSSRAGVTYPNQVGGHVIYFDLGANSWLDGRHDWPQYQQNAQRTGSYPD